MDYNKLIEEIYGSATVCTEAAAIGFATSISFRVALAEGLKDSLEETNKDVFLDKLSKIKTDEYIEEIKNIDIQLDNFTWKDSKEPSIFYPCNADEKGHEFCAALGIFGDPSKQLDIFCNAKEHKESAHKLKSKVRVGWNQIKEGEKKKIPPYIVVKVKVGSIWGETIINGGHKDIEICTRDGEPVYKSKGYETEAKERDFFKTADMKELVNQWNKILKKEKWVDKASKAIENNWHATEVGIKEFKLPEDFDPKARVMAGILARMRGLQPPIVTVGGSGNVGIMSTVPVVAFFAQQKGKLDSELMNAPELIRAVLLSHLVTGGYATARLGALSSACGCALKAGLGIAAAFTYLKLVDKDGDGDIVTELEKAMHFMMSYVRVPLCEGAGERCAEKATIAVDAAKDSSSRALRGDDFISGGLSSKKLEDTLKNTQEILKGLYGVEEKIINIMGGR